MTAIAALAPVARFLCLRHDAALHCLARDEQASDHDGLPTTGVAHAVWRMRVYARGFLAG